MKQKKATEPTDTILTGDYYEFPPYAQLESQFSRVQVFLDRDQNSLIKIKSSCRIANVFDFVLQFA